MEKKNHNKKIKIILADDHAVMRDGIKEIINREGDMTVIGEAANGNEVVKLVAEQHPDLVLMDIAMPELNGIEATRIIKKNYPDVSVLIFSAYDNEEFVVAILEARAAGYLLKNIPCESLINAIRSVYAGESIIHPDIMKKIITRLGNRRVNKTIPDKEILSVRELQVLKLGAKGLANKEIAYELSLSPRTIQTHWRNIFVKLGVSSRVEAIMFCLKEGLITLESKTEN